MSISRKVFGYIQLDNFMAFGTARKHPYTGLTKFVDIQAKYGHIRALQGPVYGRFCVV